MTGLILDQPVAAFDNPELTAEKLGRRFGSQIDWDRVGKQDDAPKHAPGLDLARLRQEWSPDNAYAPQMQEATFRIPLGIRWGAYEKLRDERAHLWIREMYRQGWELDQSRGITAYPGPYPAHDLQTGVPNLGMRECILRAWFCHRKPEPIRIELPASYFQPIPLSVE